jgi:hypothetical protein
VHDNSLRSGRGLRNAKHSIREGGQRFAASLSIGIERSVVTGRIVNGSRFEGDLDPQDRILGVWKGDFVKPQRITALLEHIIASAFVRNLLKISRYIWKMICEDSFTGETHQ